jgi:chromate transporter
MDQRPWLVSTVAGITAGATGAIAGAVIVLARQSLVDLTTVLIALSAFGLTWLKWRVPEPFIIVAAALIGLAVRS